MRTKYAKILKAKLKEGDPFWFARTAAKMGGVLASAYLNKSVVGPVNVILAPSWRCNSRCKMCDLSLRSSKGEMNLAEFKRIVDQVKELGGSVFSFLGGEPFVRKDMLEMIRYVKSRKLITQVTTNAIALADKELARKLIETDVDILTFSLDCMDPVTYKTIRGVDQFKNAIRGIKNMVYYRNHLKKNTRLNVNLVILDENIDNIMKIIRFIKGLGIDLITPYPVTELGALKNEQSSKFNTKLVELFRRLKKLKGRESVLDLSEDYMDYVINRITKKAKRIKCFAPFSDIHIDPFGNVFPCIYFLGRNEAVGSIRDMPLKELWYSKKYNKLRKNLANCEKCDAMCHLEPAFLFNKFWFPKRK